MQIERQKYVR